MNWYKKAQFIYSFYGSYWILPNGDIVCTKGKTHNSYLLLNLGLFGLTKQEIDEMDYTGVYRDEKLSALAFAKGAIRLGFINPLQIKEDKNYLTAVGFKDHLMSNKDKIIDFAIKDRIYKIVFTEMNQDGAVISEKEMNLRDSNELV